MEVRNVLGSRKQKKENKVTERALYASLFSMVLCCAMLLETTYAWFTQEISTGVAVIQTGEMSVELVVENGVDENGVIYAKAGAENLRFKAADITAVQATAEDSGEQAVAVTALDMAKAAQASGENDITYFEPGGTYYLPPIYVMNTGNIDLKYMVAVSFDNASTKSANGVVTVAEGEKAGDIAQISDLLDVISFKVSLGNSTEEPVDLATLDNAAAVTAEEGTADDNGDANGTANEETKDTAVNVFSGILEAATGEEKSISEPIVIQAVMPSDIESGYQNLQLEGIQIIVSATQVIADN